MIESRRRIQSTHWLKIGTAKIRLSKNSIRYMEIKLSSHTHLTILPWRKRNDFLIKTILNFDLNPICRFLCILQVILTNFALNWTIHLDKSSFIVLEFVKDERHTPGRTILLTQAAKDEIIIQYMCRN